MERGRERGESKYGKMSTILESRWGVFGMKIKRGGEKK